MEKSEVLGWHEAVRRPGFAPPPGFLVSYRIRPFEINVLGGAKVPGEGEAVEVAADLAVVDGDDVEEEDEKEEQEGRRDQADIDEEDLLLPVVLPQRDEREDGVAQEEPEYEAEEGGEVVEPGQEADYEQE